MRHLGISPQPSRPGGGGGWDEDPRHPTRTLQAHGFVSLAFGMAIGLTLLLFYLILTSVSIPGFTGVAHWLQTVAPAWWSVFLLGFIAGTVLAAVYNMLLFRHFNLFGGDHQSN